MYERHFGLSKPPFRITPDPEFFFPGANRGAVLEALRYAIARGEGMVKVVGEVGSGKTMLCRMLEHELTATCDIIYLANPRLEPEVVLHAIAGELGLAVTPADARLKVLHVLSAHLLTRHAENRRVVMFIEEAQGMTLETLEEIRLLSNLETTRDKLLQIVLFGQPELDAKLDSHQIRQLRERITHGFELAPLSAHELRDYLQRRLRASGHRGAELFDPAARALMARASAGLLRRVNVLADKALLAAFADNATAVGAAHVRRAIADSEFGRGRSRVGNRTALVLMLALVLGGLGVWLSVNREFVPRVLALLAAPHPAPAAIAKLVPTAATDGPGPPAEAPARAPAGEGADTAIYPTVSAATGLVGIDHLRPQGLPPATAANVDSALEARPRK